MDKKQVLEWFGPPFHSINAETFCQDAFTESVQSTYHRRERSGVLNRLMRMFNYSDGLRARDACAVHNCTHNRTNYVSGNVLHTQHTHTHIHDRSLAFVVPNGKFECKRIV